MLILLRKLCEWSLISRVEQQRAQSDDAMAPRTDVCAWALKMQGMEIAKNGKCKAIRLIRNADDIIDYRSANFKLYI